MPEDKALKIIRSILESNKTIAIEVKDNYSCNQWIVIDSLMLLNEDMYVQPAWAVTIVWINQIIPTYSIWDRVLILSTGEIGEILNVDKGYLRIWWPVWFSVYHRSEIAKLPNDL